MSNPFVFCVLDFNTNSFISVWDSYILRGFDVGLCPGHLWDPSDSVALFVGRRYSVSVPPTAVSLLERNAVTCGGDHHRRQKRNFRRCGGHIDRRSETAPTSLSEIVPLPPRPINLALTVSCSSRSCKDFLVPRRVLCRHVSQYV